MTKHLIALCLLFFVVSVAMADDRDVLLSANGTLYSVAVANPDDLGVDTPARTVLALTIRDAENNDRTIVVPATTRRPGVCHNPALALDPTSGTLFVFWEYAPNAMSSELQFTSLATDGRWSELVSFDGAAYRRRHNLRIAVTTQAQENTEQGTASVPEINVHAVWWDEAGLSEKAEYAMLTFADGRIRMPIQRRELDSFAPDAKPGDVEPGFNFEILRHPAVFSSPSRDSVDVIFGNMENRAISRLRIKPVGDARVRIPVGRRERDVPTPTKFKAAAEGAIAAVAPSEDRLAFYFFAGGEVKYLVLRDDEWSSVRAIKLDDSVTRETAVSAIRRMVTSY